MSLAEVGALTSAGMPGVWTWGFSDGWQHVFLDSIGVNHNSIGRGYETYGNGTAETVERVLRPDEERYVGKPVTSQEWYRPMPPPRKFLWSLRNNTNYMESGCLAALDYTAKNAKEMLRDFYRKGYNSWQKGVKGKPYAFAIPADQGDRRRVADMVELLMAQGIEVGEGGRAVQGRGRGVRRRDLRRAARPALPQLRRRPAHCRRPSRPTPPTSPTTTCRGRCRCTTGSKPSASTTPRSWTLRSFRSRRSRRDSRSRAR